MSTLFRTASARTLALAIPITALMLVPAFAQQKPETRTRNDKPAARDTDREPSARESDVRGNPTARGQHNDALLSRMLIIDNRNEVALAKVAQDRAKTDRVKKFAEHMIHDHTDFINKLEPFAKNVHDRQPGTPGAERRQERREERQERRDDRQGRREERREIRNENEKTADIDRAPRSINVEVTTPKTAAKINNEVEGEVRAQGDNAADRVQREAGEGTQKVNVGDKRNVDRTDVDRTDVDNRNVDKRNFRGMRHIGMLSLKQELADQCAKSIRARLDDKKGEDFDHAYMNVQVMAHMQMLDTLKVFRHHVTPDLAKVLDKGIDTTQQHLDEAIEIAAGFAGDRSKSDVNKTTRSKSATETE